MWCGIKCGAQIFPRNEGLARRLRGERNTHALATIPASNMDRNPIWFQSLLMLPKPKRGDGAARQLRSAKRIVSRTIEVAILIFVISSGVATDSCSSVHELAR